MKLVGPLLATASWTCLTGVFPLVVLVIVPSTFRVALLRSRRG